ncbi:MAG: 5-formyltetrahydrofolate cyclo-ligase [Desulfurococcaceae archaeon]|uniref:5-formyltetrahydrofolate cyclo-ligase n=1 Tax=Staphylothermus marinus TaxID=2280 RepID=A0A7C4JLL8_STAMA
MDRIKRDKLRIREYIWRILEEKGVAKFPKPIYGRIPNFIGAEKAAEKLFQTRIWFNASVVKVNPDSPQKPVRYRALLDGKIVVSATPKLRKGFVILDPNVIPPRLYSYASTINGFFKYGKIIKLTEIPTIDLVVTGSVAVDLEGRRLGKGGGYGDLEYGILREIGVVDENTPVATTVHDLQIVDYVPVEKHDLLIDYIFTPTRAYEVQKSRLKPRGIYWDIIGDRKELNVVRELLELKERKR